MALPKADYLSDPARTKGEMKTALEAWLLGTSQIHGADLPDELPTIALDTDGELVPTHWLTQVDTFESAASDDFVSVDLTAFPVGRILWLSQADDGRVVTIKHGAANVALRSGADEIMGGRLFAFVVVSDGMGGKVAFEIYRTPIQHGSALLDISGSPYSWTVPDGVTQIEALVIGGGGGGGGGGDGSVGDGGDGGVGGPTWIEDSGASILLLANGGIAGIAGKQTGKGGGSVTEGSAYGESGNGSTGTQYGGIGLASPLGYYGKNGYGGRGENGGGGGGGGGSIPSSGPNWKAGIIAVTPGDTLTITVGAGGAGGTGGGSGLTGGDTGEDGAVLLRW